MKIKNWIMCIINLVGVSLLLIIPIFNLWYLSKLMGENMFKQCKEHWEEL